VQGTISVARDEQAGRFLINYADPKTPPATYAISSLADVGNRAKWTQLIDPNAWVKRDVALGDEEEITWKSTDGTMVGGVLLKPSAIRRARSIRSSSRSMAGRPPPITRIQRRLQRRRCTQAPATWC
jgi:hypothetical protein